MQLSWRTVNKPLQNDSYETGFSHRSSKWPGYCFPMTLNVPIAEPFASDQAQIPRRLYPRHALAPSDYRNLAGINPSQFHRLQGEVKDRYRLHSCIHIVCKLCRKRGDSWEGSHLQNITHIKTIMDVPLPAKYRLNWWCLMLSVEVWLAP